MLKNVLFQTHWLLGISAGIIVAIVGVTGGAISFEEELLHALNKDIVTVQDTGIPLTPPELLAKLQANNPGKEIMNLNVFAAPGQTARVTFAAESAAAGEQAAGRSAQRRRGETRYVNPYTGELVGGKELHGQKTLQIIERTHRGMVAGPTGRALVTIATFALVFFGLSGLYLRWPKSGALKLATWFKIHGSLKGRAFLWNLHSVVGTWMMPIYVVVSLSGLYFGYDWYRQAMLKTLGAAPVSREVPRLDTPSSGAPDIVRLWATFESVTTGYDNATLTLPANARQAVEIRYLAKGAVHERATDRLILHPITAEIIKHDRFSERKLGDRLAGSMMPLHSGSYFGVIGKLIVMIASFAMPLFAVTGWMLYLKRREAKARAARAPALSPDNGAEAA